MKYITTSLVGFAVLFAVGLVVTGPKETQAGIFGSAYTSDWDSIEPDNYKIEVYGFDLRVYEWTTRANPNITCIAMFGETGPTGLSCFPNK